MEEHVVTILEIGYITHDVKYIRVEKPEGYNFTPGQATDVSINNATMRTQVSPFTFTVPLSAPYIEFIIKRYPAHKGVTDAIHQLNVGDELILHEVFGDISYRGKGVFIAGGAGITPFVAILRDLKIKNEIDGNKLIFANKSSKDIILGDELSGLLGSGFINILSEEESNDYKSGFITEELLKANITEPGQKVYLCGPPVMMKSVLTQLEHLGRPVDTVIMDPV